MTSRPAAAARCITSAGGCVPSEALLWLWRSARISGRLSRQLGRSGPERQVQLLAGIAQVSNRQRLHHEHAGGVRPEHEPQPVPAHLAREGGPATGVDVPDRELVVGELDHARGLALGELRAGVGTAEASEPRPEANARLL